MDRAAGDLGAMASDDERRRHLVRVAMAVSGAVCGAYFERVGAEELRSVVIEGLFPPQSAARASDGAVTSSRARLVAWAWRGETVKLGESWLGAVVRDGRGELIAEATQDGRIVRHADAALAVRSIIAVPVKRGTEVVGLVALANPVHGGAFVSGDLVMVTAWLDRAATKLTAPAAPR
jgi:GAF domain-containing protein